MIESREVLTGTLDAKKEITGNINVGGVNLGTTNYNDLSNKPLINGEELVGNVEINVPTKVSELENDSGFITDIPEEYITEEELNNKGYITTIPEEYATKEYVNNAIQNNITTALEGVY